MDLVDRMPAHSSTKFVYGCRSDIDTLLKYLHGQGVELNIKNAIDALNYVE